MKAIIRKSALDLPLEFRKTLNDFVDKCIGPINYEYPAFQFFDTEEYKDFLKKNNATDNDYSRGIYSADHQQNMYDELDVIFKDYICQ